jgi:hypothetical protein
MAVLYLPRPTSGWAHITLVSPLYAERRGLSRSPLGCCRGGQIAPNHAIDRHRAARAPRSRPRIATADG